MVDLVPVLGISGPWAYLKIILLLLVLSGLYSVARVRHWQLQGILRDLLLRLPGGPVIVEVLGRLVPEPGIELSPSSGVADRSSSF